MSSFMSNRELYIKFIAIVAKFLCILMSFKVLIASSNFFLFYVFEWLMNVVRSKNIKKVDNRQWCKQITWYRVTINRAENRWLNGVSREISSSAPIVPVSNHASAIPIPIGFCRVKHVF